MYFVLSYKNSQNIGNFYIFHDSNSNFTIVNSRGHALKSTFSLVLKLSIGFSYENDLLRPRMFFELPVK